MQTYAWLEFYRGMWHLLTHLLADPENATRSWTDGQEALQELAAEGWILMLPYPRVSHAEDTGANTTGYGLTRYGSIN